MEKLCRNIVLLYLSLAFWIGTIFSFFKLNVLNAIVTSIGLLLLTTLTYMIFNLLCTDPFYVKVRPYDLFWFFADKATNEVRYDLRDLYLQLATLTKNLCEARLGKTMKIKKIQGRK